MRETLTRSRSMKECLRTPALRRRLFTRFRTCHSESLFQRRRHEEEKVRKKTGKAAKARQKYGRRSARTIGVFAERRRRSRSLHGRARRLPCRKIWSFREPASAHRLATPRTYAHRAVGHPGIQPESEARIAGLSRWILAQDSDAAE